MYVSLIKGKERLSKYCLLNQFDYNITKILISRGADVNQSNIKFYFNFKK